MRVSTLHSGSLLVQWNNVTINRKISVTTSSTEKIKKKYSILSPLENDYQEDGKVVLFICGIRSD